MIGRDEVTSCGTVLRSHGVGGEIVVPVSGDLLESTGLPFLVLDMDGILVPFYIESFRPRSATSSLVKLEGIETMERADELRGKSVWLLKKYISEESEEDFSPEMFIGLKAEDLKAGYIGVVEKVDDSTANVLFLLRGGERETVVPASPELVVNVDILKGVIVFDLPEGILDL